MLIIVGQCARLTAHLCRAPMLRTSADLRISEHSAFVPALNLAAICHIPSGKMSAFVYRWMLLGRTRANWISTFFKFA